MRKTKSLHSKINQLRVDRCVALVYGVKISDIHHNSTSRYNAEPRMVSMFIQHEVLKISHPRISRYFHKRTHSTSIKAKLIITNLIFSEPKVKERVNKCVDLYENYEVSKVKQRYNLHHRIRQSGVRVSGPNRTIYITHDEYYTLEGILKERINRLQKKHHYSLQLTIV